jgi:hypothetical protein
MFLIMIFDRILVVEFYNVIAETALEMEIEIGFNFIIYFLVIV